MASNDADVVVGLLPTRSHGWEGLQDGSGPAGSANMEREHALFTRGVSLRHFSLNVIGAEAPA
jgi:hypothetical protein